MLTEFIFGPSSMSDTVIAAVIAAAAALVGTLLTIRAMTRVKLEAEAKITLVDPKITFDLEPNTDLGLIRRKLNPAGSAKISTDLPKLEKKFPTRSDGQPWSSTPVSHAPFLSDQYVEDLVDHLQWNERQNDKISISVRPSDSQ